jgi:hypothetical protein
MKKYILIIFLCILSISVQAQHKNNRYVTCEIVQDKNNAISISPNKDYLKGTDYWKNILYNITDGSKKTFSDVNEAISYLGGYGWKNIRQYKITSNKSIHFVMQKQCDNYEMNGTSNTKIWKDIILGNYQK